VSDGPERDTVCVEADGLELEIDVAPEAAALDGQLPAVIASAVGAANTLWRGFDKPTNVLSFPSPDTQPGPARTIGDIAISYETAAREAAAEGKTLGDHVAHLSVHGFLHLLGYDHESDNDAEEMEGLERVILARIGVSDPYVAHEAEG